MEELLDTDPEDLLPEHRSLLTRNFKEMGEAPPSERQYWIAEMDAATSAADKVRNGVEQSIRSHHSSDSARSTQAPLIVTVNDNVEVQWRRDD